MEKRLTVHGKVSGAHAKVLLRIYDRDLRKKQKLGEVKVVGGRYSLKYSKGDFANAEKDRADLLVIAYDADDQELARSPIRFNAKAEEQIDLVIDGSTEARNEPELERVFAAVLPLMEDQGIALWQLEETRENPDFTFLASETGLPIEQIRALAEAAKLDHEAAGSHNGHDGHYGQHTHVSHDGHRAKRRAASRGAKHKPPKVTDGVTVGPMVPFFYGLLRGGGPSTMRPLLEQTPEAIRAALEAAGRDGIIPADVANNSTEAMKTIAALRAKAVLKPADDGAGKPTFGDLVTLALPAEKRDRVAAAYVDAGGTADTVRSAADGAAGLESVDASGRIATFLSAVETEGHLTPIETRRLKATLGLEKLTGGHLPLIQELARAAGTEPTAIEPAGLAALDVNDWKELVSRRRDPTNPDSEPIGAPPGYEDTAAYARSLAKSVEETYPSAVAAARIGREAGPEGPFADTRADLTRFFANNADFKLGATLVSTFFDGDTGATLAGVADAAALRRTLDKMDRAYKVAPSYDGMRTLLGAGVESAQAMVKLGRGVARKQFGPALGGDQAADDAYGRAIDVTAGSLSLYLKVGTPGNRPLPWVLRSTGTDGPIDLSELSTKDRATWDTLFGAAGLCNCDHCQSLFGPAAYFADLLTFLGQTIMTGPRGHQELLLSRRPDLAHIELTCDNTDIKLPYIDLVNEVLEGAVADPKVEIIGDFSVADFDQGNIVSEIALALSLTAQARMVTQVPGQSWAIRDPGWRYEFTMNPQGTGITVIPYPQTSGSEEELRAMPQHVNGKAYFRLARAAYPWSLPFNLPVEEARVYLHQLGIERPTLMEAFAAPTAPATVLDDDDIAAEHLGLSALDAKIITLAVQSDPARPIVLGVPARPWTFWGFNSTNGKELDPSPPTGPGPHVIGSTYWDLPLARVALVLERSNLRYADLLELLDTRFINPGEGDGRPLSIQSMDENDPTTCDPAKLRIAGLATGAPANPQPWQRAPALQKIHRFVRLQHRLGWSAHDLDRAITALPAHDLTPDFLRQLWHVRTLESLLKQPLASLLSFWHDIDATVYRLANADGPETAPPQSLYAKLFRNPAVGSPLDEDFTDDPADLSGTLSAHAATIAGALEISAADFEALTTGPRRVVPDDSLDPTKPSDSLDAGNLAALYRHAVLARGLDISIDDLLRAKAMLNVDPFADTATSVRFVERVRAAQAAGFDIPTLAFLLRSELVDPRGQADLDEATATLLLDVRSGLQKIADDTALLPDPGGTATRAALLQLRWKDAHVQEAVATLADTNVYEAQLAVLPGGLTISPPVAGRVRYEVSSKTLSVRGVLNSDDRDVLHAATADAGADLTDYLTAVDAIYETSRAEAKQFLADHMRAFELPTFWAPAAGPLGAPVSLPNVWRNRVQYDAPSGKLKAFGALTDDEVSELEDLSPDIAYRAAVRELAQQARDYDPRPNNRFLIFLSPADTQAHPANTAFTDLFDSQRSIADRFAYVLEMIRAYQRRTAADSQVKQKIADTFNLQPAAADALLTKVLRAPSDPTNKWAIADLTDPAFESSGGDITAATYPNQFAVVVRAHKAATIVNKLAITADQLAWLATLQPSAGWLSFNALPAAPGATAAAFDAWERLVAVLGLRRAPFRDADLANVLTLANDAAPDKDLFLQTLADASGWERADVEVLMGDVDPLNRGILKLTFPDDFKDGGGLVRLRACFKLMKRSGASLAQLDQWRLPDLTAADPSGLPVSWNDAVSSAKDLKSTLRAKFSDRQWFDIATPARDQLREQQRAALVAYLLSYHRELGEDKTDLYDYFLIDVEMGSCMRTTRLKQAICSVQLFVQRCLLHQEPSAALDPEDAKEWNTWRKLQRVEQANREVFVYPENWIEPSLRDDKTPFFKELENELLQDELTTDRATEAIRSYLQRLEQVSHLEMVGLTSEFTVFPTYNPEPRVNHLFGRTPSSPHVYFYRRQDAEVWSPWEKVDLDIEGDHLIPVVSKNRRLYLCWPTFTEKSRRRRSSRDGDQRYWEIKLAWSERKNGRWLPRKLSKEFLFAERHPWSYFPPPPSQPEVPQDPKDFRFRDRSKSTAFPSQLVIDCYGTTTDERPPPATTTTTPTLPPNVPLFVQENTEWAVVNFTLDRSTFPSSELSKVSLVIADLTDGTSTTVAANLAVWSPAGEIRGILRAPTGINGHRLAYAYRSSAEFAFVSAVAPGAPLGTKFMVVDLTRIHAAAPVSEEPLGEPDPLDKPVPFVHQMRPLGRFFLDSCKSDMHVASPIPVTVPIPALTSPYADSHLEGMMIVEDPPAKSREHFAIGSVLGSSSILTQTPGTFRVLPTSDNDVAYLPLVYQDDRRAYFVVRRSWTVSKAHFDPLYHPFACDFIEMLDADGLAALLSRQTQSRNDAASNAFRIGYNPNAGSVDLDILGDDRRRTPREDVDFSPGGAFSQYNWELFFHIPLLVATKLSTDQKFEEARNWFHYIFDPTSSEPGGRERFWRFKPFYDEAAKVPTTIAELLRSESDAFAQQLEQWHKHPFQPFLIARLRPLAFMKTVVMKYIENLIAWGDRLFARDTIESINEATQLYVLASRLLGKRPEETPPRANPSVQTFATLRTHQPNELLGALVEIENYVFPSSAPNGASESGGGSLGTMPLFCIPSNDKLLGFWDTIAERLNDIRHCRNIQGIERELPIFDPRIEPGLLVRAAAAGVDLDSVLDDLYAPLPHYRYAVMQQKAVELCNDVKALGAELLSALEKRDAERLALLRSGHELDLLKAVQQVKRKQVEEAQATLDGLQKYQVVVAARQQYYLSRPFMNAGEIAAAALTAAAIGPMTMQAVAEATAGGLHLVPDFKIAGPTEIGSTYGGSNVGPAIQSFGSAMGTTASILNTLSSTSATLGGYQRRQDDWTHQADLATKELEQVAKQILAAEIRLEIADKDLENHEKQIEQSRETDAFMKEKYTNGELYDWMVGQISAVYFQSYKLAYAAAKRAERSYRNELCLRDSSCIQFGYWDSLKKGLLAGQRLELDLRRMESDYLDKNKREYEITKHVSLALHDPFALLRLKETGVCEVDLPEGLFDLDFPGHYMRRIKSASLTIPCVTGPYAGVNCTLTLLKSKTRIDHQPYDPVRDEKAFIFNFGQLQSIATAQAQNDSGLFELNFRDDRYLPFEGQGAISTWRIELPRHFKSFDYQTISDVILHVRYTSREGGESLRDSAVARLKTAINAFVHAEGRNGLVRMISLRQEQSTDWYRFVNPAPQLTGLQSLTLPIDESRLPLVFRSDTATIKLDAVDIYAKVKPQYTATHDASTFKVSLERGPGTAAPSSLTLDNWNGLLRGGVKAPSAQASGAWTLKAWLEEDDAAHTRKRFNPDAIDDIILVAAYRLS